MNAPAPTYKNERLAPLHEAQSSQFHAPAGTAHLPRRFSAVLLVYGAWTLIATLISTSVFLDNSASGDPSISGVRVVIAFAQAYLWASLTFFIFWLVRRFAPERYGAFTRAAIFAGVGIVIAFAAAVLVQIALQTFSSGDANEPFAPVSAIGLAVQALTYTGVLAAALARHYFQRLQAHREAALTFHAQTEQLKAQLADARLSALRAQLNPHFLFNTLHAIAAMAGRDPSGVRSMLARLSGLLRMSLDEINEPEAPLRRELAFVRQYLDLMRMQLRSAIDIREEIDDEALNALVPTLLLQPLIENAIQHGVARTTGPGCLSINAHRLHGQLRLRITNNGPAYYGGFTEGIGLRNTRERLQQLYGAEQGMQLLHDAATMQFIVEVELPFHTRPWLGSNPPQPAGVSIAGPA